MCCEECCQCDRIHVDHRDSPLRHSELRSMIHDVIRRFDFKRFGIEIVPSDSRIDVRVQTWRDRLSEELADELYAEVSTS